MGLSSVKKLPYITYLTPSHLEETRSTFGRKKAIGNGEFNENGSLPQKEPIIAVGLIEGVPEISFELLGEFILRI